MIQRRVFIAAAAGLSLGRTVLAQAYPARPVRLIVPYPVGTANEVFARVVAQKLGDAWQQPVVVEALAGAGGVVGTQALAKAAADGYTLGWVSSPHAINAALYGNLPYDPIKDFRPIASLASTPLVFVTGSNFAGRTSADLIALAKASPGRINFASNGNGSSSHLGTELLANAAGVRFTHVPYKNTGQMTADLISGQVDFAALGVITSLSQVQGGKLRALAVTGSRRASLLPGVPTVAETVPGYETKAWMGLLAPAGVPDAVVARVQTDAAAVMRDPAIAEAMTRQGLDPDPLDAAQFARRIENDIRMWKKIVAEAGVKVE